MATTNLILHPSTHVVRIDGDRTQIRTPDGDHFTLFSPGFPMAEFVEALRGGTESLDSHADAASFEEILGIRASVMQTLESRHILVEAGQETQRRDALLSTFDYVAHRAMRVRPLEQTQASVRVVGSGLIAGAARDALVRTGQLHGELGAPIDASLTLVCADFDHFSFFQDENEKTVELGAPALFAWKSGPRILIGPLVRPRQSACFNCYAERRMSNTHFIEEFEAMVRQQATISEPLGDDSGLLRGLVAFLIARHVSFVNNEVVGLVKPGDVYSYHIITGETRAHPVLKLPRCVVCGNAREDSLARAVRDLL